MPKADIREGVKMIHVRLPDDVHKALRIKVAELDTDIQHHVLDLIIKDVAKKKASDKQRR